MDTKSFTGRQLAIMIVIGVAINVIGGFILYQITKPKTTDPTTPPTNPNPTNLGTTQTPAVTTSPTTTMTTQG